MSSHNTERHNSQYPKIIKNVANNIVLRHHNLYLLKQYYSKLLYKNNLRSLNEQQN